MADEHGSTELPGPTTEKNKDYARAILHISLDDHTWSNFKITSDTPLTEFADSDFSERKGYVVIGEVDVANTPVAFHFELRTDMNDMPTLLAVYPSTIEEVIHLELPDRIEADHSQLQKENGDRIRNLLEKMKR